MSWLWFGVERWVCAFYNIVVFPSGISVHLDLILTQCCGGILDRNGRSDVLILGLYFIPYNFDTGVAFRHNWFGLLYSGGWFNGMVRMDYVVDLFDSGWDDSVEYLRVVCHTRGQFKRDGAVRDNRQIRFCNMTIAHFFLDSSDTFPVVWIYFDTTPSNLVAKEDSFSQAWLRKLLMDESMVNSILTLPSGVSLTI